jgi:hypothetical protein
MAMLRNAIRRLFNQPHPPQTDDLEERITAVEREVEELSWRRLYGLDK